MYPLINYKDQLLQFPIVARVESYGEVAKLTVRRDSSPECILYVRAINTNDLDWGVDAPIRDMVHGILIDHTTVGHLLRIEWAEES